MNPGTAFAGQRTATPRPPEESAMHASHPMPFGPPVRREGGAGLRRWAGSGALATGRQQPLRTPAATAQPEGRRPRRVVGPSAACRGLAARSPIGRETAL